MDSKKIAFIILFYVTVIGALNWGMHACGYNLVEKLAEAISGDSAKMIENSIYYIVAACGLAAGVMYTMYLIDENKKNQ